MLACGLDLVSKRGPDYAVEREQFPSHLTVWHAGFPWNMAATRSHRLFRRPLPPIRCSDWQEPAGNTDRENIGDRAAET
jgi:hypothetical protein